MKSRSGSSIIFQGKEAPQPPSHHSSWIGLSQRFESPIQTIDIQNLNSQHRKSQPNMPNVNSFENSNYGGLKQTPVRVSGVSQYVVQSEKRLALSHRNSSLPTRNITDTQPQKYRQVEDKLFQHISVQLSNKKPHQDCMVSVQSDVKNFISQRQSLRLPHQFKVKSFTVEDNPLQEQKFQLQMQTTLDCLTLEDSPQVVPVVVSLKTADRLMEQTSVDVICVIDIAQGRIQTEDKIKQVKLALIRLIELMEDNMRLQIISYHSECSIFTRLMRCSVQNKLELLKSVQQILPAMSSNLVYDMTMALQQLKIRKQKNQTSCIFLISDTYDKNTLIRVLKYFQDNTTEQDEYIINTFGIGIDHDPMVLSGISDLTGGSYHFVQTEQDLGVSFAKIIGGLASVVAKNFLIHVNVKEKNKNEAQIKLAYGDKWKFEDTKYTQRIQYILAGSSLDLVFELNVQCDSKSERKFKFISELVTVKVELTDIQNLSLIFLDSDSQSILKSNKKYKAKNEDLTFQHQKVRGAHCIKKAREACENNQFSQAQLKLRQLQSQVSFRSLSVGTQVLLNDISNQINSCEKDKFYIYGQKLMLEIYYQLMDSSENNQTSVKFLNKLKS